MSLLLDDERPYPAAAGWIEHQLAELGVVGSNPAGRTI